MSILLTEKRYQHVILARKTNLGQLESCIFAAQGERITSNNTLFTNKVISYA